MLRKQISSMRASAPSGGLSSGSSESLCPGESLLAPAEQTASLGYEVRRIIDSRRAVYHVQTNYPGGQVAWLDFSDWEILGLLGWDTC
jgi:hypothetical protein